MTLDWRPNFKNYPHFDAPLAEAEIVKLVRDPSRVAQNNFYPFMRYEKSWQPFRARMDEHGHRSRPDKKTRPIRYASRRDAYIFSYYRYLLSEKYEGILSGLGLGSSVIAYRKIAGSDGHGKSNIEFAREAFQRVAEIGNCATITIDISSSFESIDHDILRKVWLRILEKEELPADHEAVFRAITRYAVVDRDAVYERLGFLARTTKDGREKFIYTIPFKEIPKKLCSNSEFREKICGQGKLHKSLVDVNRRPYGIPQGAPLSDLLANMYLLDFDAAVHRYASDVGGYYFRYSDDIMLILPGGERAATGAVEFVRGEIADAGPKLKVKDSKTTVALFRRNLNGLSFQHLSGAQGKNGLEYLGFRFDGNSVFIRDSTMSRLYRKVSGGIKAECSALLRRYPGQGFDDLVRRFDYSGFMQRYGRVEDFTPSANYDTWTFWTYARRANRAFGTLGRHIPRQLRNFRKVVRRRVALEIARRLQS